MTNSTFAGMCWLCWPAYCKCPPTEGEVEQIKAERFLLDRELQRENRRAREFSGALKSLASAVWNARQKCVEAGGLDNLSADLNELAKMAAAAADLLAEPRNSDRISEFYREIEAI